MTVGVLGLVAFWSDFGFRLVAVIAASIWYGGDAIGHVRQMIVAHNFAPGNAGVWFPDRRACSYSPCRVHDRGLASTSGKGAK